MEMRRLHCSALPVHAVGTSPRATGAGRSAAFTRIGKEGFLHRPAAAALVRACVSCAVGGLRAAGRDPQESG
jgi:hypothetical protein